MNISTTHFNRPIEHEEQQLYDHLLRLVQAEIPAQLVQRFRKLFIDGVGYPDAEILVALDKIASSKSADQEFRFVLNRCCHILINRWQARPPSQSAIPELIALFEEAPSRPVTEFSRSRSVRRLRELVKNFSESEQYFALRRLAQVVNQGSESNRSSGHEPLSSLMRRYPYLYEHCLLAEGSTSEHQQTIRHLQATAQRQYDLELSNFITYQIRRAQTARQSEAQSANRLLQPAKNPTLLSDRELCIAIKHFAGKSQGSSTYRDLAQRFVSHSSHAQNYKAFKDGLYEYITASINPQYGNRQFNKLLYTHLKNTLPDSDFQKPNDFLIVRTCSQLLNFLVIESPQKPNHFVFIDLISNLGPTLTTGLLLKIVLVCRKAKPYLEKRFSLLFNHYESFQKDAVQWLIQGMENLNVALSTNFSTVDLSFINRIG